MIPFLANFTGREDRTLDHTLQHVELPGILHRLITLCPDVIENGLRPPASVLAETDQLFTELDITKQFRDDCLDSDPSAETPAVDVEKAVAEWLRAQSAAGMVIGRDNPADTILKELKHQPDIKYVRRRRDGKHSSDDGRGKVWVYSGVRLRDTEIPATSDRPKTL
jgi:phage/plasmid-associated DNA primase